MGVIPDKFDFVEPALDTVLTKTTYIDYTDISYITSTETEKIPHDTDKTYSSSLKKGKKKVTKEGKDGLKEVTYTEKLINGVSVEKTVTKTVTLSKAVDEKVTVGTKTKTKSAKKGECVSTLSPKKKIELDENGVPVKYKSKMKVRATAYTHTGNRCSTGVKPQPGYIAVNPKVIPYGTEMFIKTTDGKYIYGYAVAADTGGFIKKHPTGIDLFFDTKAECVNFGVRTAEIYILN
jgi:3D (Asp-Asp-Asp) domain-containing protein